MWIRSISGNKVFQFIGLKMVVKSVKCISQSLSSADWNSNLNEVLNYDFESGSPIMDQEQAKSNLFQADSSIFGDRICQFHRIGW